MSERNSTSGGRTPKDVKTRIQKYPSKNTNVEPESGESKPQKKRSTAAKIWSYFWKTTATLIMLGVIAGCIVACYLTTFLFETLESSDLIDLNLDLLKLNYSTIIYTTDSETGQYVEKRRLESSAGSRVWVEYEEIPFQLRNTLVAAEDKRFYEHMGVDFGRTAMSTINYVGTAFGFPIYESLQGASTITQQLIKNLTDDNEVDYTRKVREIFRALTMEKAYSKDQVLEAYFNITPFGNNTQGIGAAAYLYFNKELADLHVCEMASIIGITQSPTALNPYTNYDANQERKEWILGQMFEQGYLTETEYEAEMAYNVVFYTENNEARVSNQQSYFDDYLITQVTQDLAEKLGVSTSVASKELFEGGYRIYSTEDSTMNNKLEHIYLNYEDYFPAVNNEEYPQSAFIVTEPNGAIVALAGGIGEKDGARTWSRATDTKRQPGSTIKAISCYPLAVESDLVHWSSLLLDGPYNFVVEEAIPSIGKAEVVWQPKNYYSAPPFEGYMIMERAIQRSTNMIPIRLTVELTPQASYNFMYNTLNMKNLVTQDIAQSPMALGALTYGVTPMEMAGAYQMYANGGTYTEPYSYTHVLDSSGNIVLQRNTTPTRVITAETATVMNQLLQRVVTGMNGTGTQASLSDMGIAVAGKTGTTDNDVDQWFVGLTPYYIGVAWMGYDDQYQVVEQEDGTKKAVYDAWGNPVPNSINYSGLTYPPPVLWKTVMSEMHEGLEPKDFSYSSNVVSTRYCTVTGHAATDMCTSFSTGWYKSSNIPTPCPLHGFSVIDPSAIIVAGQQPWEFSYNMMAPFETEWMWMYKHVNPAYDPLLSEAESEQMLLEQEQAGIEYQEFNFDYSEFNWSTYDYTKYYRYGE